MDRKLKIGPSEGKKFRKRDWSEQKLRDMGLRSVGPRHSSLEVPRVLTV